MKIGIFGGSFNPIHFGHIQAAREILASGIVQEIWFVPCYKHAFKPEKALAPFEDRLEMLKLAIEKEKRMKAVDVEKKFKIKYTIALLKILKKQFPMHEFFFIIGSDLVQEFSEWKDPEGIVALAKLIVLENPSANHIETDFINKKNCIFLKQKTFVNVSAKTIRRNISDGKSVENMLSKKVIDYIIENRLY